MGLLAQTAVSEDETIVDPGTDVAKVSLLNYVEANPEAVNSAFWSVFVPIDEAAPGKEPYPIMFLVSVAVVFDQFDAVEDAFWNSFDAYPSWLVDQYEGMEIRQGRDSGRHLRDSTDSFGISHWNWYVRDRDEILGFPDFFLAGVVASAKDALVFNWAGSYGSPPIQEVIDIVDSSISHWNADAESLVPNFDDFPQPMGVVSSGPVTDRITDRIAASTPSIQTEVVPSVLKPTSLVQGQDVSWPSASAINNRSEIVGMAGGSAVFWRDGEISHLDALPGDDTSGARGINDAGQIVGSSRVASPALWEGHAVLWEDGRISNLGTFPGDDWSRAWDINSAGWIVGASGTADGSAHAVVWKDGEIVDLGMLPGVTYSSAFNINDSGQIVGESWQDGQGWRAVLWEDDEMVDLGTLPGDTESHAYSISNTGWIAGSSGTADGARHAVVWKAGEIFELGTLPGDTHSSVASINDLGQIVGWSGQGSVNARAALWEGDTIAGLGDLPGDIGSRAEGINSAGQVVGSSASSDGTLRATLWA